MPPVIITTSFWSIAFPMVSFVELKSSSTVTRLESNPASFNTAVNVTELDS